MTMKLAPLKNQGQVTLPVLVNEYSTIQQEEEETSSHLLSLLQQNQTTGLQGKITFLGTGSALPSKYRNVASALYQQSSYSILLDCGEGTCNQLLRLYPTSVLYSIKMIVISHSHADHHLCLPLLFDTLAKLKEFDNSNEGEKRLHLDQEPIYLFAPRRVKFFLDYYARYIPWIQSQYLFVEVNFDSHSTFKPPCETIPQCIREFEKMEKTPIPSTIKHTREETGLLHFSYEKYNIQLSFFPVCFYSWIFL